MMITYENEFWFDRDEEGSRVFQMFPNVFGDTRGNFTEIFKEDCAGIPDWMMTSSWIKQINRSESISGVFRGMHAQQGKSCQSKLVEAVTGNIVDIILDARPQSSTFGKCMCFELSSEKKNRLFVPKGFLHGFFVRPSDTKVSIFQYIIGGSVYDKSSEFSVNPKTVLDIIGKTSIHVTADPKILRELTGNDLTLSDKDTNGKDLVEFLEDVKHEFDTNSTLWYK